MWDFLINLVWALFFLILICRYESQIESILSRISEVKIGNLWMKIVDNKASDNEREKAANAQVVRRVGDEKNGYIIYSSGLLRQTITKVVEPSLEKKVLIVFPIAFPAEIIGFSIVSECDVRLASLNNSNCEMLVGSGQNKREIKIIVSGMIY